MRSMGEGVPLAGACAVAVREDLDDGHTIARYQGRLFPARPAADAPAPVGATNAPCQCPPLTLTGFLGQAPR